MSEDEQEGGGSNTGQASTAGQAWVIRKPEDVGDQAKAFVSAFGKWREFLDFVAKHQSPRWAYRGQAQKKWKLKPTVGRNELSYSIERELLLLEEFKRQAPQWIGRGPLPANDVEWLALGQHHGLPTRLIDWSFNPLVAAYYACDSRGDDAKKDGVVHAVCPAKFKQIYAHNADEYDLVKDLDVCFYRPPAIADRIVSQRSILSLHSVPKGVFKPQPALTDFTVPAKLKVMFRRQILGMGVDKLLLVGGLEGLAGTLEWRYSNGVPLR